ncbi:MAG TPA: exodeoxyribonuclease VII small subunit [Thermodesulfobacteriota bacterium]|nr:exodeoxyribonuclease VII small subunit [Thermodesulfobacteriota bacterium]
MDDGGTIAAGDAQPFEATLKALEAIVARLESGALDLEEALAAFERGVQLARACEARLAQAERRVELLLSGPDGSLRAEPFGEPPGPADGQGA